MKGLRKYLSPFTPDQSGAVSVLFHYGGMLIIMDAGGCVGNICGYDEPRWTKEKSAIFSAGLRDLDAILGRDELLIKKTGEALRDVDAKFVGLVGTPVPSVIATDYRALKKLMERDYGLPVIPVETNGFDLYDEGESKAYLQLFKTFLDEESGSGAKAIKKTKAETDDTITKMDKNIARDNDFVGVIGYTPLDSVGNGAFEEFQEALTEQGYKNAKIYGINDKLGDIYNAAKASRNLVVSPAGIKAARWLKDKYGIPYQLGFPLKREAYEGFTEKVRACEPKKILIMHQQILANSLREQLRELCDDIDVASWFMMNREARTENDVKLNEESELLELVKKRGYDVVIGDPLLKRALPDWNGCFLSLPHFAISASIYAAASEDDYWRKAGEEVK